VLLAVLMLNLLIASAPARMKRRRNQLVKKYFA
jgi:hypothetical protein